MELEDLFNEVTDWLRDWRIQAGYDCWHKPRHTSNFCGQSNGSAPLPDSTHRWVKIWGI